MHDLHKHTWGLLGRLDGCDGHRHRLRQRGRVDRLVRACALFGARDDGHRPRLAGAGAAESEVLTGATALACSGGHGEDDECAADASTNGDAHDGGAAVATVRVAGGSAGNDAAV